METTDELVDTGKNLFMQYGLAALASTGTVKGAQYLVNKLPNIPAWAKEWAMIAGPAVAGIVLSTYSNKRSAIAQGVAGGMVLASANGLSDKLLKANSTDGGEMADATKLEKGDMIVKADGVLYDQDGNAIARISGGEQGPQQETQPMLPEMSSFEDERHLLGEGFEQNSWETGEAWQA